MKVFLDTNVILDFYDSNRGHYMPTAIVFDLANVTRTCPLSLVSLCIWIGEKMGNDDVEQMLFGREYHQKYVDSTTVTHKKSGLP